MVIDAAIAYDPTDSQAVRPAGQPVGLLGYTRDNHLPSGSWVYEYPDRKPELLERVKPACVPEYEE